MVDVIFIVGCARSGTSIFGELLAAHSDVYYLGEQLQPFWHSFSPTPTHHEQGARHVNQTVISQAEYKFKQFPSDKIIIDKCPPNSLRIPFLHALFPEAKFIHLVRNGLDVACSLRPGLDANWSHLKPVNWQQIQTAEMRFRRSVLLWQYTVRKIAEHFRILPNDQCATVKYEELVASPLQTAGFVFRWLGLDVEPEVVAFSKKINNDARYGYQAAGQDFWRRDNHCHRVERWRENMEPGEAQRLSILLQKELEQFGYL